MGVKRTIYILGAFILSGTLSSCSSGEDIAAPTTSETIMIKKASPILFVDNVQLSVEFFTDKLGFSKTMEVPYEDGLQFAAVASNGVEIMFQASDVNDETFTKDELAARVGQGFIYFEIDDFDKIITSVSGAEIVKDAHETSYGAKEIYIREPGGNVLGFAKQAE